MAAWAAYRQDSRGFGLTRSPTNPYASMYWSGMAGAASAAGARANSRFTTSTRGANSETTLSIISSRCAQAATDSYILGKKKTLAGRIVDARSCPGTTRFEPYSPDGRSSGFLNRVSGVRVSPGPPAFPVSKSSLGVRLIHEPHDALEPEPVSGWGQLSKLPSRPLPIVCQPRSRAAP